MDNYICIDGTKIELTPEQIAAFQSANKKVEENQEKKPSPFDRQKYQDLYYYIDGEDRIGSFPEIGDETDQRLFEIGNYCSDKALMELRTKDEIVSRLLWRFAYDRNRGKLAKANVKYYIYWDKVKEEFEVGASLDHLCVPGVAYFEDRKDAYVAIEEVVEPFMKKHPNFNPADIC